MKVFNKIVDLQNALFDDRKQGKTGQNGEQYGNDRQDLFAGNEHSHVTFNKAIEKAGGLSRIQRFSFLRDIQVIFEHQQADKGKHGKYKTALCYKFSEIPGRQQPV